MKNYVHLPNFTYTIDYMESRAKSEEDFLLEQAGIEPTEESTADEFTVEIIDPFNPKEISISMEVHAISGIISRLGNDEINLDTDFQRRGNLWTPDVQSRLIESMMLRFPLPAFYFDAESDDNWLVVDGLQRLWTLKNFVIDRTLTLRGLEILTQYTDMGYDELPRPMQRRILETQITAHLVKPGTPRAVKYNIFKRINTGGFHLNFMEIRHALNQGAAADFLKRVADNQIFKTYVKVSDKRMADRELILRYVAFSLFSYKDYIYPLNKFLDQAVEKLSKISDSERIELENNLYRSLEIGNRWFSDRQFSRSPDEKTNRLLLNQALFEVWTSLLAKLSDKKVKRIEARLQNFIKEYWKKIESPAFSNALSRATTASTSVETRFKAVEELLNKFSS